MSSNVVPFSDVYGENVELSDNNTVATWTPRNSGGWACSDQEWQPGDTFEVKIEGSGRCDIGFMKKEQCSRSFKTLNEIRAHRKTCSISVTFNETGEEVTSSFREQTFKKRIEKGSQIWIAIFIRYGNMSAELLTNASCQNHLKFSSKNHGQNIILESDNTRASTVNKSPASICYLSKRLQIGDTINLVCASEQEGGREVSRYELKLQVSETCPEDLKKDFKYLFEVGEAGDDDPPLTTVEVIEKDECNGNIAVTLTNDKAIRYTSARGKQNTQALTFSVQDGVWIVLALYGVRVRIAGAVVKNTQGEDQPDSTPEGRRHVTPVPPESLNVEKSSTETMPTQPVAIDHAPQKSQYASAIAVSSDYKHEMGEKLNLQKHFPFLVQEIETLPFCDHCYCKNILTQIQMDEIQTLHKNSGAAAANRELLKVIRKKQISKSDMIEIVEEVGQPHLLEKFYPKEDTPDKNNEH